MRVGDMEQERVAMWRPSLSPGIELCRAKLVRHAFPPHMHETYVIGFNDFGRGSFQYRGETKRVYPGTIDLLNPGEIHTGQVDTAEGWAYRNICISESFMQGLADAIDWRGRHLPLFRVAVVEDRDLHSQLQQLFHLLAESAAGLERDSLWLQIITALTRKYGEARTIRPVGRETATLKRVRVYIEARCHEEISLAELAEFARLSPYYLIRAFRECYGLPPHQFQRNLRLLKAKKGLYFFRQIPRGDRGNRLAAKNR
ncbi:AraC-like protein [Hydrogenispora ethanolica]|uniref:AraC-like protein n=1 Tax=Hydrogenispora ethanolica TaxID=1082276 RepID=A0A4R1RAK4_HYDET|nr:AraC family transcriptional regulator [Hydrogenispora ethanolica]TCL62765.1 AraC-like protein [Hydrogenispora ethanolica]